MRPVSLRSEPAYEGLADNHSQETPDGAVVGGCCAITHEATGCDLSYDPGSTGSSLSDRAISLVDGDRQKAYGPPEDNLARIGQAWAAIFGMPDPIPAYRVALAMAALKAVRAAHRADEDSITDLYGYAVLAERLRP